ncbi:hypothetical protein FRC18_010764, partial [Serendipita sp. 400]
MRNSGTIARDRKGCAERSDRMALSASEKYVVEQYGGLFLYAATICRLLKDRRRRMMMAKMILTSNSPQDLVEKMDELHLSILRLV